MKAKLRKANFGAQFSFLDLPWQVHSRENVTSHKILALYTEKLHNSIQENDHNFLLRFICKKCQYTMRVKYEDFYFHSKETVV
jgi:hypothetical protein